MTLSAPACPLVDEAGIATPPFAFGLGGVPIRLRSSDPRVMDAARAGLGHWAAPEANATTPPLDLAVAAVRRFPAGRWVRGRAAFGVRGPDLVISSRWFRIRTDARARRMTAAVDPSYGLGDFYRQTLATALLLRGGFLLHAAALDLPGRGVCLFCGPSGFGKTTLARLAPRRAVLADDSVAIRAIPDPAGGGPVLVYPTPFFGDFGRPPRGLRTAPRPVARIVLLAPHARGLRLGARKSRAVTALFRHGVPPGRHALSPVRPGPAAAAMLSQVIAPAGAPADVQARLLAAVATVAERVPAFRLSFRPDPSVWRFLGTAVR